MEPASTKIYFREVDPHGNDSLSKIAQRIAPGSVVLDLGCGPGALAGRLIKDKRCTVDGVEGNPEAAALAAPHLRTLVVADLEAASLATHFGGQRYDYVVCADVLEHLRHPEKLLAQLPALLTPAGRVLLSVPNVGYAGLVGALINGEFRYREAGLLDGAHLRFFTRKSLSSWLDGCGLQATHVDTVAMPIDQSEFAGDHVESLPPAVLRTLLAQPDALTYQFIVEVAPTGSGVPVSVEPPAAAASFTYLAKLFHRSGPSFDEAHSTTVHGEMGKERQRLRFAIPASSSDVVALRLDPTNRPGYLRLYTMALYDANDECVWKWDESKSLDKFHSNQLLFIRDDDGVLLVAEGDDPWFELPVWTDQLKALRGGGALEVELSWPQSPDSFVVIKSLLARKDEPERVTELTRLNADLRSHIRTLNVEIKELQAQLRAARESLARIHQSLTFRFGKPLHAIVNLLRRTP
ncbi:MAG: class I SAM-dependent methyltransferase [Polyangia bacterium]